MLVEAEAARIHQLRQKDEFLSHVSHELRAPLTSIYSFASIIADGLAGDSTPEQKEYLGIILKNVDQLQAMIEDLLLVMQAQTGQLTVDLVETSVSEAVVYAVDTLSRAAAAKRIRVHFSACPNLEPAYADPTRLRQILTILLDNAIKFTPDGGSVDIRVELSDDDPSFLRVEVSDTGRGISPESADHIFERLYQASASGVGGRNGLGLGLYLAKDLVLRLGGKIWVRSEQQQGSRFFFTLPVFSLESFFAPILSHKQAPGDAIAVFSIEIQSNVSSLAVRDEILSLVRTELQACLLPDTDLLLPDLESATEDGACYVIAYTRADKAEEIRTRILTQLRRNEQLQPADFTIAVSYRFLEPISRPENQSMESFVGQVAAGIRAHIGKTEIHERAQL